MGAVKRVIHMAAAGVIAAAVGAQAIPTWAAAPDSGAPNGGAAGAAAEKNFVAGVLVNDARDVLRDGRLPVEVAAREAAILLQLAVRLDDSDLRHLKLLAEAARAAGDADVQRDALRKVISSDKGDLVSQVRYIDLLASASQTLEDHARVYQAALDQAALDPQIRSEMAVRLARVAQERGDVEQERRLSTLAVSLNDVNIPALRNLVRLAAQGGQRGSAAVLERVKALTALLNANPYEPDAWLEVARLCESANLHERAADFLITVVEQSQMDGLPPDGALYLELTMEQAIAGRRVEAFVLANGLAQLPDAPLQALMVAILEADEGVPGSGAATRPGAAPPGDAAPATQPAKQRLAQEIHRRLVEMVKAQGEQGRAAALADAAGIELSVLPAVNPEVETWIDDYAKLVSPEDVTLARLRGWLAYRQGKTAAAREILQKAAATDPLAQIGLARLLLDAGDKVAAARQLQDVWGSHPTGLLALQTAEAARKGNITLNDTEWSKQVRDASARLTPALMTMHREPIEVTLMSVNLRKAAVGYGEPAWMTVRITNTTSRVLPVGPDGVVKTMLGLSAPIRDGAAGAGARGGTLGGPSAGIYAVEDLQRVYRLEPRQVIEAAVRVDQGALADVLENSPAKSITAAVSVVSAPRLLSATQFGAGVGGQALAAGDLERSPIPLASAADFSRLLQDVSAARSNAAGGVGGDPKVLARVEAAGAIWRALAADKPVEGARAEALGPPAEAREKLAGAMAAAATSADALVRTIVARGMPRTNPGDTGGKTAAALAADGDPLVRLMVVKRLGDVARSGGDAGKQATAMLESQRQTEKDELVKQWIAAALEAVGQPTSQPAADK